MCRVLKMAHLQRLKIIYVFKQGVLTDMAGKVLVVDDEKMICLLYTSPSPRD